MDNETGKQEDTTDRLPPGKPIAGKGFSDELRLRIESRLERETKPPRRSPPLFPLLLGLSSLLILLVMQPYFEKAVQPEPNSGAPAAAVSREPLDYGPPVLNAGGPQSALLIGLRLDEPYWGSNRLNMMRSTYRTMLIAPIDSDMRVTAEGSGILMPYKQSFWFIQPGQLESASDSYTYLSAYPADSKPKEPRWSDRAVGGNGGSGGSGLVRTETLLFAGNQYISMKEQEWLIHGGTPRRIEKVRTRTLPQLASPRMIDFTRNRKDPDIVTLQDVFGTAGPDHLLVAGSGDQWTPRRTFGRWSAYAAEPVILENVGESFQFVELGNELPNAVTSHDRLIGGADAVRALRPNAADALSSPSGDVLAVFDSGSVYIYAGRGSGTAPAGNEPALTVPLKRGEVLVMAQWATGRYVDAWVQQTRKLLKP